MDSGVHSSLHPNSHHKVVIAKFNSKVYYLPLYERHKYHYKYANTAEIKDALSAFNWNKYFLIALSIRRFLFLMERLSML